MRVGNYELEAEVGRGGMGSVWRGRGPDGKPVAVKFLITTLNPDEAMKRFFRERRLQAELGEAQGFVPLLDSGASAKGPYLAMPFLPGGTLADRLYRGPMTVDQAVTLAIQLATAVGRAHSLGIVHRDLKPANVLFTADGRPLIGDLGLAKHFGPKDPAQSISLTKTGEVRGTVGYMAPEQTTNTKHVGPAADVFSLGAIYECVAGRPAFTGDNAHEVLARLSMGELKSLDRVRADAPPWLAKVVARCLTIDAKDRWPDGGSLARALDEGHRGLHVPNLGPKLALAAGVLMAFLVLAVGITLSIVLKPSQTVKPADPVEKPPATPTPSGPPAWYRQLSASDRPSLPLPKGISFGEGPGEYKNDKDGSVLVYVPGGTFPMGVDLEKAMAGPPHLRPDDHRESPVHEVRLSSYFIGKLELTNAQFDQFVKETSFVTAAEKEGGFATINVNMDSKVDPKANRKFPRGDERAAGADEPVVQVSWSEAREYCRWAGLRLPTEAEWERAAGWDAKNKKKRIYPWGDESFGAGSKRVANAADDALVTALGPSVADRVVMGYIDGYAFLSPVGSFPDGASPVGCLDMGGNAYEWVEDVYAVDYYTRSPARDPVNREERGLERVFRDGSYTSGRGTSRCTIRHVGTPLFRRADLSFRVARAAE